MELNIKTRHWTECLGVGKSYVFYLNGKIINEIVDRYEAERFLYHLKQNLQMEVNNERIN